MPNISNLPVRVPDEIRELSVELHDYLQAQAETLFVESTQARTGQTVLPLSFLTEVTDSELYALGVTAQFQHGTLGLITALYVQFSDMVAGGGPCGFLSGADVSSLTVTNQFTKSGAGLIAGILPNLAVPLDGQFGWVMVSGVNLTAIDIRSGDTGVESSELYWSGDNELAVDSIGGVVGQQLKADTVDDSFAIGSIKIAIGSSTGQAGQAVINTRIDTLESTVNENAATVTTLTQTSADGDTAIALSVTNLTSTVGSNTSGITESNRARASADEALAIRIETVNASISPAITAQVNVETSARTTADAAIASQITVLDTKYGGLTNSLLNAQAQLVTSVVSQANQSNALVEQTAELNASLSRRAEGAKENLLDDPAAGVEDSSTGTIIKQVDVLIADAGIEIGVPVSLSGFVLSDETERLGLRISFLETADALISDSGILAQTESDVYAYGIVEGILIPAGTLKIRCEAVRVSAGATSISAKQFMLVAGESASRYPYTTANARATTVLSARVTTNEGNITSSASAITTLESTVDDPIAGVVATATAVTNLTTVVSAIDGDLTVVEAQYTIKLNVNGRVAGFGLASTLNEAGNVDTSAVFEVDTFIVHDGTTGDAPFVISDGAVKIGASRLADGTAFTGIHGVGATATIVLDGKPGQESIFLELAGIKLFEVTTAGTTLRDTTNGILLDTSGGANSANSSVWNSILAATDSAQGSATAAADSLQLRAVQAGSTKGATSGRDLIDEAGATLGDASIVTLQGTSAAIIDQGALATKESVDLTTSEVTNKSLANLDSAQDTKLVGIATGADVTGDNQAATIASQGNFATVNEIVAANAGILMEDGVIAEVFIGSLAVTTAKIGLLAVDTAQIALLAVGSAQIANLAVGSAQIGLLQVTSAQIDNLTVGTDKITASAVSEATSLYSTSFVQFSSTIATIESIVIDTADVSSVFLSFTCMAQEEAGSNSGGDIIWTMTRHPAGGSEVEIAENRFFENADVVLALWKGFPWNITDSSPGGLVVTYRVKAKQKDQGLGMNGCKNTNFLGLGLKK